MITSLRVRLNAWWADLHREHWEHGFEVGRQLGREEIIRSLIPQLHAAQRDRDYYRALVELSAYNEGERRELRH
jgi:hypothetical protein